MSPIDLAFWTVSGVAIASAVGMLAVKDIFRAALLLIVSLLSIAALFVLLNAEFLAVVQVLVYVGAISILIIFVIMLTKNLQEGNSSNNFTVPALAIAMVLFASMVFAFENTQWNDYESLGLNVSQADHEQIRAMFGLAGSSEKDEHFAILGISKGASKEEIKKAYRHESKKHHPDRVHHLGESFKKIAEEKMQKINKAYAVLHG